MRSETAERDKQCETGCFSSGTFTRQERTRHGCILNEKPNSYLLTITKTIYHSPIPRKHLQLTNKSRNLNEFTAKKHFGVTPSAIKRLQKLSSYLYWTGETSPLEWCQNLDNFMEKQRHCAKESSAIQGAQRWAQRQTAA